MKQIEDLRNGYGCMRGNGGDGGDRREAQKDWRIEMALCLHVDCGFNIENIVLTLACRNILNSSGRTSVINCELYSSEQTCRKSCNNRSTIASKRSSCAFDNTCIQQCSVHGIPRLRNSIAISIFHGRMAKNGRDVGRDKHVGGGRITLRI